MRATTTALMFAVIVFAACAAAQPAFARRGPDPWGDCWPERNESGRIEHPDAMIVACTAVIQANTATPTEMAHAFHNRGSAYLRLTDPDYAAAIADFNQAIALDPSLDIALFHRGEAYLGQREYARAIADFNDYIERDPETASPHYLRGQAYAEDGQLARARADFDFAAAQAPENYAYQYGRCRARVTEGAEYDIAQEGCDEAMRLRPDDPGVILMHGLLALRREHWETAQDDFDHIIRIDAASGRGYFGRGVATLRLGRTQEGQADIARGAELTPNVAEIFAYFGVEP